MRHGVIKTVKLVDTWEPRTVCQHAPGTHTLWVPGFPEPTPVGYGVSVAHTLWVTEFP